MGVSYYAAVIYGIPTCYREGPKVEVQKFDEDTGEPYMKKVNTGSIQHFDLGDGLYVPVPDISMDEDEDDFNENYNFGADNAYIATGTASVDALSDEEEDITVAQIVGLKEAFENMCDVYFPSCADLLKRKGKLKLISYGY